MTREGILPVGFPPAARSEDIAAWPGGPLRSGDGVRRGRSGLRDKRTFLCRKSVRVPRGDTTRP
jgi:hypothetical protein